MPSPRISIVIPAYNEEECNTECVDEVCSVMDPLGEAYEVVVVDDGSTDATLERRCAGREMNSGGSPAQTVPSA